MCYTAIPDQTGFLAIREMNTSQKIEQVPKSVQTRKGKRSVNPVPKAVWILASAIAPQMESMSHDLIAGRGDSRRYNRCDSLRGKRLVKRQHKPNWRYYEKY